MHRGSRRGDVAHLHLDGSGWSAALDRLLHLLSWSAGERARKPNTSPGLGGYWVNNNAPRVGAALPAIVCVSADARCPVSPGSSPVAVPPPPPRSGRPPGLGNMTSWPFGYGTVPPCLLLCCVVALCAEASGEWRLHQCWSLQQLVVSAFYCSLVCRLFRNTCLNWVRLAC